MRQRQVLSIAALAVALSQSTTAIAQQPASSTDPVIEPIRQRVSKFFEQVSQGSIKPAYLELLGTGQLSARETERQELETKTGLIQDNYGECRGFDLVYSKRVGSDLVFMKCLYKCSRFPVLWHLTFYRAPAGGDRTTDSSRTWQVISIRFDTDLEVLTLLKE